MCRVVCRNGKYNCVLQNCIVTKITVVKTEEHVMKTSIINTSATVCLALPEGTVKQVSSSVVLLMCTLVGASIVAPFALKRNTYVYSRTSVLGTFVQVVPDCSKIIICTALYSWF